RRPGLRPGVSRLPGSPATHDRSTRTGSDRGHFPIHPIMAPLARHLASRTTARRRPLIASLWALALLAHPAAAQPAESPANPPSAASPAEGTSESRYERAMRLQSHGFAALYAGAYADAIDAFTQQSQLQPGNFVVHYN